MFTTSCMIKNNSKELRNKLEEIGYKPALVEAEYEKAEYLCCGIDGLYWPNSSGTYRTIYLCANEDSFLALAALRNDSEEKQWHVVGHTQTIKYEELKWRYGVHDLYAASSEDDLYVRKATPFEIINRFEKHDKLLDDAIWLAVNENGQEVMSDKPLQRFNNIEANLKRGYPFNKICLDEVIDSCNSWIYDPSIEYPTEDDYPKIGIKPASKIFLPKGTIEKIIGREMTWKDEPVKIKKIINNEKAE